LFVSYLVFLVDFSGSGRYLLLFTKTRLYFRSAVSKAGKLRIQYEGGIYHLIIRDNYRLDVFASVGPAQAFELTLMEARRKKGARFVVCGNLQTMRQFKIGRSAQARCKLGNRIQAAKVISDTKTSYFDF